MLSGLRLRLVTNPGSYRPPTSSSELAAINDSLFEALFSAAESANVLTSKVYPTRAEQHVKLEPREFLEVFNEY